MTERVAYFVFLAVVGGALALMTAGLAVVWFFLVRRNRRLDRGESTAEAASGRPPPL